uniref:Putative ixostatin n=1 Tax=Ixodes ricinus TaxID=34613 RepID=A0A0K8RC29_IXORI
MIRTMILPLAVVLLAASGYLHAQQPKEYADRCSSGLGKFITTTCSSSSAEVESFSPCSYTCVKTIDNGQTVRNTYNLPNGLPCAQCMECCDGRCKSVHFELKNPLSLKKSCST